MAKKSRNFYDLDKVANKIMTLLDPNLESKEKLSSKAKKMQHIINRQADISKGVSGSSIVDFNRAIRKDAKIRTDNTKKAQEVKELTDPMGTVSQNLGEIFSIYQENYKNKYLEIQNLEMIAKIIPSLGAATKATLDRLCSADTALTDVVARQITYPQSLTETQKAEIAKAIENIEEEYNLKKKLKNAIFKPGLIVGSKVVYVKSYKDIFAEYSRIKSEANDAIQQNLNPAVRAGTESNTNVPEYLRRAEEKRDGIKSYASESIMFDNDHIMALESCIDQKAVMESITGIDEKLKKQLQDEADHLSNFYFVDSSIPFGVLESVRDMSAFKEYTESATESSTNPIGTMIYSSDNNGSDKKKPKVESFDNEYGTYIKPLDFKKLIPYDPMGNGKPAAYFYVHCSKKTLKENLNKNKGGLSSLGSLNTEKMRKDSLVKNIVDSMTSQILDKFSEKFVVQYSGFKELIADCIISNGFVDKDYKIQMIPASDIIEFKFNEDENGQGQSILADSLFPGTLLASIMMAKHMNYINKAGDRTLVYTHKGATTMQTGNQVERVIRSMQQGDVNFADYGSSNLLFSKLGRNTTTQIPTGKTGNHLVEFERIEGQNIDLGTEYETFLNRWVMLGTHVPSSILEYTDNQEYASQTETINIGFAEHINSLQGDVTRPLTELYRTCILNYHISEEIKNILRNSDEFKVKLPAPKILQMRNNSDAIGTTKTIANDIAEVIMLLDPQDSIDDSRIKLVKAALVAEIVKDETSCIDWVKYLEMYEKVKAQVNKDPRTNPKKDEEGGDAGGDEYL